MKKIFIVALTLILCFAIFIPVSAETYNDHDLPDINDLWDKSEFPYALIQLSGTTYYLTLSQSEPVYIKSTIDSVKVYNIQSYRKKSYETNWVFESQDFTGAYNKTAKEIIWSSHNIYDENGVLYIEGDETYASDIPEETYTIPAGLYIINPTPTMPTEDITQDFSTYFSVMINNGLENVVYNGLRMKFTPTTIEYNLDGTLTTVYKGPPLADVGWSHDGYRQVTFIEDVAVSEEFYNLFMANTTPPPEYKPPYVFSNDGITYDGSTYATYENDDTKRIEIDGKYCCMFQSNSYTFVATASEPLRLQTSSIKTKSGTRLDLWTIKNGVITYSGDKIDFAVPHSWIAGNHSILNWDDDFQYHGFDVGMVFPTTPQTQLPTVVGAEMMMGVTREMIAILPCLIALLTALLGLRKALSILRMILETA